MQQRRTRACVDAASVPAPAGGEHTGRNPTNRGKLGCNPLVESIPAVKGLAGRARKRPGKLHADRAYASRAHRAWLRRRGIAARIARYAWSRAKGSTDGGGSSSAPWVSYTAFADCAYARAASRHPPGAPFTCLLAHLLAVCRTVLLGALKATASDF